MKIKWQWFIGGKVMFWISVIMIVGLILGFTMTYIIDPTKNLYMKEQYLDPTSIKDISEQYVRSLNIDINKPVVYRFVKYKIKNNPEEEILLGTFHEWNNTYYIDISVDLYKTPQLTETVRHETRHMIVEYLRDRNVIDLVEYTEEIAQELDTTYNSLFDNGVYLLRQIQVKESEDD